ncbi:hypothetical protein CPB86DRAFT_873225 [Serendipita vermifera]|nr:hypothetical protein CPB86DRAFT_873225 [Serendipita vermifera]
MEIAHGSPSTSETPSCPSCGRWDQSFYEKQIRRLRERLEHSQLLLSAKESECHALRKAVSELNFQVPSSRRPYQPLPNELLQEIFAYATNFSGLVRSPWNDHRSPGDWPVSLFTRQSIPLVCHQWYANGLQFLYRHIKLSTFPQIRALYHTLDSLSPEDRLQRVDWIQGLELLLGPTPGHRIRDYWHLVGNLILEIPPGNLKVLALDSIHREPPSLNSWVLARVCEQVEVLQLGRSGYTFDTAKLLDKFANLARPEGDSAIFRHLREFVFPEENGPVRVVSTPLVLIQMQNDLQNLHTLALSWPNQDILAQQCLSLLYKAKNLTNIYLRTTEPNILFYRHFETFLTALPTIEHLTLTISLEFTRDRPTNFAHDFVHVALKDITIFLEFPSSYKAIQGLDPLFTKIRSKELPNLDKIVIRGPYAHGCLDSGLIFPAQFRTKWSEAIKLCDQMTIKLVIPENDLIHLWEERHGPKKEGPVQKGALNEENGQLDHQKSEDPESVLDEEQESGDEGSDDDLTNTSDDSQWYRLDEESDSYETNSDNNIWNDSDDEPYRYVAQPDIELVDPLSDLSEDEG